MKFRCIKTYEEQTTIFRKGVTYEVAISQHDGWDYMTIDEDGLERLMTKNFADEYFVAVGDADAAWDRAMGVV